MEIRQIKPEEEKQSDYLASQAFFHGDRELPWQNDPHIPHATRFGVWDAAGLQAQVVVLHFRAHLGPQAVVPMGGIAGVACLPASRGKGYASACLKHALEQMREMGQVISTLFPFSWDFYRNLGWEWVGVQRRYALPGRILRPDPETENVRAAAPADRDRIIEVYTQFAGRYRGMIAREEKHWNSILDDAPKKHTFTYLYERDGSAEGYLTYRGGKWKETWLREFIALTPRARRALLGLLRRHEMQTEKFAWHAPDDDPLWLQFYHWDIGTKIEPKTQGRVVDVVGALRAWRPATEARGAVNLAVQDACAPWNSRTWQVAFEGGEVSVHPTRAEPQVSLDIQALSQAYFGTPTVDAIRAADRLTVHDEAGYAAFRALLDGPPMWMNDDF